MKIFKQHIPLGLRLLAVVATALCLGGAAQQSRGIEKRSPAVAEESTEDEDQPSTGSNTKKKRIVVEAIEPGHGRKAPRETAWMGVSVEEASEALASQLGLDAGQGLVVGFVASESPAAKAGVKRNDVLVQLGDQVLVHPAQLRKLVQMHKEGDSVDVKLYRNGKKQTVSIKLGKTVAEAMPLFEGGFGGVQLDDLKRQLSDLRIGDKVHDQMKALHESLAKAGLDRERLTVDVQRSLEAARDALKEALTHKGGVHWAFGPEGKDLESLAQSGMDLEKDTTVVLKKDGKSVKTMVKADDSGTWVIVANPKKHLTAHDKDGKLLFDGEIETTEDQEKVPQEVWEKVKPMLDQMGPVKPDQPEAEEDTETDSNS